MTNPATGECPADCGSSTRLLPSKPEPGPSDAETDAVRCFGPKPVRRGSWGPWSTSARPLPDT